jgi:hypothetical protein
MHCLRHQLLLLCLSFSMLLYTAASPGRLFVSLSASNGVSTAQDLPVYFNHQRPLLVSQGCPADHNSCSLIGHSEACCQPNSHCALDAAGNVACCPSNAVCTGTIATCPTGWKSCPQSLGGGCCHADHASGASCTLLSPTSSTTSNPCSTTSAPGSTLLPNCAYGPPCGYYHPQCCAANEYCYTDLENVAQCTATKTGYWQTYTTTYIETDIETLTTTATETLTTTDIEIITSTFTSLGCQYSLGEVLCGNICCLAGQFCQSAGQCRPVGGGSTPYYSTTSTTTVTIPARPGKHTCAAGGSTVPNAPFPFCYVPTSLANMAVCSSYWSSCQLESTSCFASLEGSTEFTVSGPGVTSGCTAASCICSELSVSACYNLELSICALFPAPTTTFTTVTSPGFVTTTVPYQTTVGTEGTKGR